MSTPQRRHATTAPRRYSAGVLTLVSMFVGALNFLYAVVLTHGLQPADYAIFMGAQALMVVNGLIGSAGIPWVLAKETAASSPNSKRRHDAITFAFWANVTFGLLAGTLVFFVVTWLGSALVGTLVGCATVILAVGSTGLGLLQGEGRTERIAVILFAEVVLKVSSGIILVFVFRLGDTGAAASLLIGAVPMAFALKVVRGGIGRPHQLRNYGSLWWSALRMSSLQLGVGLMAAFDILLVTVMPATRPGAGPYQAAANLGRAPLFVASAVSTAVFPTLTWDQRVRRRADGLYSYASVAIIAWALLLTMPTSVLDVAFGSGFQSLTIWLPFTATLGVGLGFLNMLTSFAQSEPSMRKAIQRMGVALILTATGIVISARVWGLPGLAWAAMVGAWIAVLLLATLASERAAAVMFCRRLVQLRTAIPVFASVSLLFATRDLVGMWVCVGLLAGVLALSRAFPEFAILSRVGLVLVSLPPRLRKRPPRRP